MKNVKKKKSKVLTASKSLGWSFRIAVRLSMLSRYLGGCIRAAIYEHRLRVLRDGASIKIAESFMVEYALSGFPNFIHEQPFK